jgi:multidrug efflux pump subunit AcrA (membrane-fusion protein)
MTANVSISSDKRDNVLYLPARFVLIRPDGSRYVKILVNKQVQEIPVKVGLRTNDLKLEILDGITLGQEVVLDKAQ